jgi:hypothetical protein
MGGMSTTKTEEELTYERILEAYQAAALPEEQRAAARRRAEERAERARLAGVYERALQIAGTIHWSRDAVLLRLEEW